MKKTSSKLIVLLSVVLVVVVAVIAVVLANNGKTGLKRHLEAGNKYLDSMDYNSAIAEFSEAIQIDPKDVDAYIGKIAALLGLSGERTDADLGFEDAINAYITLRNGIRNTENEAAFDGVYVDVVNKVYSTASQINASGIKDVNKALAGKITDIPKDNKANLDKLIDGIGDIVYPDGSSDNAKGQGNSANGSSGDGNTGDSNNPSKGAGDSASGDSEAAGAKSTSEWVIDIAEVKCFGLSALDIAGMSADSFESYAMGMGLGLSEFFDNPYSAPGEADHSYYNYHNDSQRFYRSYSDQQFGLAQEWGNTDAVIAERSSDYQSGMTNYRGIVRFNVPGVDSFSQYISLPADFPDIHMSISDKIAWFAERGITDINMDPASSSEGFTVTIPSEYLPSGMSGMIRFFDDTFTGAGQTVDIMIE